MAWRVFGLLVIVGAVWGLLAATRLLRAEEDEGRWELLLAGQTTPANATEQAIAGLAVGWLVLFGLTAAAMVAAGSRPYVGVSVSDSAFYALAVTASAAMFLAIGALTSQLAGTRRQANGVAASVLGGSFLLVVRLERWVALAWICGLAALAFIFGIVARSAAAVGSASFNQSLAQQVGRLGGHHVNAATVWIGYEISLHRGAGRVRRRRPDRRNARRGG